MKKRTSRVTLPWIDGSQTLERRELMGGVAAQIGAALNPHIYVGPQGDTPLGGSGLLNDHADQDVAAGILETLQDNPGNLPQANQQTPDPAPLGAAAGGSEYWNSTNPMAQNPGANFHHINTP